MATASIGNWQPGIKATRRTGEVSVGAPFIRDAASPLVLGDAGWCRPSGDCILGRDCGPRREPSAQARDAPEQTPGVTWRGHPVVRVERDEVDARLTAGHVDGEGEFVS